MDVETLIKTTLDIPVIDLSEPLLYPCATWYKSTEETELSGSGKETEASDTYEIDIWCQERDVLISYATLLKQAISLNEYCTIPDLTITFDTNGKVWRANLNFKHVKEDIT